MKKFFIKICKLLGYEILDQNSFSSPTLRKELNEELSILNEKSIVLPLGWSQNYKKSKFNTNCFKDEYGYWDLGSK